METRKPASLPTIYVGRLGQRILDFSYLPFRLLKFFRLSVADVSPSMAHIYLHLINYLSFLSLPLGNARSGTLGLGLEGP